MGKYREINGKKYPRVTSILSVIAKPELYGWYAKHGTKANQILADSAKRGSAVHHAVESLQSGHKWDDVTKTLDKEPLKYLLGFKRFNEEWEYKQIKKFNEKLVISEKHEYCGEVDEYGLLTHKKSNTKYDNVLLDYKTSSGIYFEYKLQVSAYWLALYEMGEHPERAGILRLDVSGNYELQMYNSHQLEEWSDIFLSAKKVWEAKEREKRD